MPKKKKATSTKSRRRGGGVGAGIASELGRPTKKAIKRYLGSLKENRKKPIKSAPVGGAMFLPLIQLVQKRRKKKTKK